MMIELGKEVRDRVSGFQGIAVARYQYLQGCERYSVQRRVIADGTLPDPQVFDAPDLEVVGDGVATAPAPKPARRPSTGGPHDHQAVDRRP